MLIQKITAKQPVFFKESQNKFRNSCSIQFFKKNFWSDAAFTNQELSIFQKYQLKHIIKQKPAPLKNWIINHHGDWVGHAVWTMDATKKIFESKQLRCSEHVLRSEGKVEYEKGQHTGERKIVDLPKINNGDMQKINQAGKKLGPYYGLRLCEEQKHHDLDDTVEIESVRELNNFRELLSVIAQKYATNPGIIGICYEMSLNDEEKIDVFLSKVNEKSFSLLIEDSPYSKKTKKTTNTLFRNIYNVRNYLLPTEKLLSTIRTHKNRINWYYGAVAVIKGKAKQIIGIKEQDEESLLLSPWQNKGEFFSLNLTEPDTIVLGPQEAMAKFQAQAKKDNITVVTFDQMSPAELDYFDVPQKLRQNPLLKKMS